MASSAVCNESVPTSKENLYTGNKYSSGYWKLHKERIKLPVWSHKSEFLAALEKHRCILLEAETGSGKTTQIPQWCVEWLRRRDPHKNSVVCCTQPRRLATVCVAQRVAAEMDVELSDVVGYSIRFEEAAGYNTLLKYCTDGMLLAESSHDEMLMRYDLILLDEVHERSMITDVVMGLVKRIMQRRPELRVVVMSASLKTGNFEHYFYGCRLMQIAGRSFPVDIIHSDCDSLLALDDYIDKSIKKAIDIHRKRDPGDILIFLTGQEDVEKGCEMLEEEAKKCVGCGKLNVIPLYGSMQHDQQRVLMETQYDGLEGRRRCIVATNVAETSMTIDGIVFVIDPGFCKRKIYNPRTKLESLLIQRISRASAVQRAGRAGRTRPGICFRLYTEHCYDKIMKEIVPEIKHTNLDSVILRLKKCGIDDIYGFDLIDKPSSDSIRLSIILLTDLGALDHSGRITTMGEHINILPVDPPLARMMLESVKLQCSKEVISICAMLSAPKCFRRPRGRQPQADQAKARYSDDRGDHLTLLRIFNAFVANQCSEDWCYVNFLSYRALQYADDVRNQLVNVMHQRLSIEVEGSDSLFPLYPHCVLKALLAGSFMKLAFFRSDSTGLHRNALKGYYVTVESQINLEKSGDGNHRYMLHPSSVLFKGKTYSCARPEWVLFNETIQHSEGGNQYLQTVSIIRPEWLLEVAPVYRSQISATSPEVDKRLREHENGTLNGMVREFESLLVNI